MADFGLQLPSWHYFSNRGIQEEVTHLNHSDSSRGAICANALSLIIISILINIQIMEITFFKNALSSEALQMKKELFTSSIQSLNTRSLLNRFRSGDEQSKKYLPAVSWQCAGFKNGVRKDADAIPNGLFALDIDHIKAMNLPGIQTPLQLFDSFKARIDELDIVCVHQTPSADGLRVVALCQPQFSTLAENQAWLASEICCGYDAVCKDWARLFFLSVEEDFFYIDWETLFDEEDNNNQSQKN